MTPGLRAAAAVGLALLSCVQAEAQPPLFHELDVRLDPERGWLYVEDAISVTDRSELLLALRSDLVVKHLTVNGEPFSVDARTRPMRVPLPGNGTHSVTLRYEGTINGTRAFIDERGAFLPANAGWMPGYDEDKVGYRLRVSTPPPYRAVATGEIVDLPRNGPAVFIAKHALEGPALFAGRFVVKERQHAGTRLMTWFPAPAMPLSARYLENAGRYLDQLQARIGPYPHGAFHVVAGPLPVGLGFPGLTYVSERILRLPFMQTRSLAHEIAHSWWGNGIAVDYATGNWAEGLTTYLADHALAKAKGPDPAREMRLGWLRDYAALPDALDMSVRRFVSKTHDGAQVIGYNKVAFLFHMLERELTTAGFDAGLRQFWARHRGQVASWDDLRTAFEDAAGRELGWFFSQWIDRAGAPSVSLGKVRTERTNSGYVVHVTLKQSNPTYHLAVPLEVQTKAGIKHFTVPLEDETGLGQVQVAARPIRLAVDPTNEIFRQLAAGESTPIFRDVTLDPLTAVVLATGPDTTAATNARQLTYRLLRRKAISSAAGSSGPLVVVGLIEPVTAALAAAGIKPPPPTIAHAGTARAWATRRADGASAMIVSADNAAALAALSRALPHYRRYGYVVFEGHRAITRGVWPARHSALVRRLD